MKKLLLLSFLALAANLFAQKGTVKGFVQDKANGEAIPYSTIKVEGTDFGAATDDQGFFTIPNLAVGNYKLVVSFVGYENDTLDVEIKKSQTVNLKVFL